MDCQEQESKDKSNKECGASTSSRQPRRIIRRRQVEKVAEIDPVILQKVLDESGLPIRAYSFEIEKTVQRIVKLDASHVSLQMPEGLLMYATVLADVLKRLAPSVLREVSILGDVTYGACCIDDLGAQALGSQLLVHYGHSCLVPLQHTVIPCLYVFVEIQIDVPHMVACLDKTLQERQQQLDTTQQVVDAIYLLGTVQFRHALVEASRILSEEEPYIHGNYKGIISIPQVKPLSPGEVLGCTSPILPQEPKNAVVCFVADGRFHLESTLISNPHIAAFYRYDPYSKTLTLETYDHDQMKALRSKAIQQAATAKTFGILMGTLGRQGNPAIVQRIRQALTNHGKRHFLILVSEITPAKLALLPTVEAWVQIACPRLSVDWGHTLCPDKNVPVLSPYELFCCLEETTFADVYPMDYYSQSGGPWTNYYQENKDRRFVSELKEEEEGQGC